MKSTFVMAIATLVFSIWLFSGCAAYPVAQRPSAPPPGHSYHHPGPPPHAPAHGYRHKHHDGYELEYNATLGVYVVLRVPDIYFGNNLYIRMSSDGRWLVSATIGDGWRPAAAYEIPPKLKAYKEKGKHKKKKK